MHKQKILILGASGMLGHTLFKYLSAKNFEVYGTLRNSNLCHYFNEELKTNLIPTFDLSSTEEILRVVNLIRPNIIINCVGVIKQLAYANDPLITLPINSLLPHKLSQITKTIGARLIHISTDCVFSGRKGMYTEHDQEDATDLYGISKKIGEVVKEPHVITIRTSIIGHELNSCHSLLEWFLNQEKFVDGYANAFFSGLPTIELSEVIEKYIIPNEHLNGLYHVSSKSISKYHLLKLINEIYDKNISIKKNETFSINRSLDSIKFQNVTGYTSKTWQDLILKMKNFG
jgi:dTDP-4-dehydrorhamnose reductase